MEPWTLPKLTEAEYKLLMLCKGNYKGPEISVPVDSIFIEYPQFYTFYSAEYWAGETDIPYPAEEIECLFIALMSELLFKLSSDLFKVCVLDAFGQNTLISMAPKDKECPHIFFKTLRSYLRLRISTNDYRYLKE